MKQKQNHHVQIYCIWRARRRSSPLMTLLPSDLNKWFCFLSDPCNNTISYMTQHLHSTHLSRWWNTWVDSEGEGRGGLALIQYIISCPVPLSDSVHTQHSAAQRHKIIQRLSYGYNWETDRTELLALEVYRLIKQEIPQKSDSQNIFIVCMTCLINQLFRERVHLLL